MTHVTFRILPVILLAMVSIWLRTSNPPTLWKKRNDFNVNCDLTEADRLFRGQTIIRSIVGHRQVKLANVYICYGRKPKNSRITPSPEIARYLPF